jgi:hypothetical protein
LTPNNNAENGHGQQGTFNGVSTENGGGWNQPQQQQQQQHLQQQFPPMSEANNPQNQQFVSNQLTPINSFSNGDYGPPDMNVHGQMPPPTSTGYLVPVSVSQQQNGHGQFSSQPFQQQQYQQDQGEESNKKPFDAGYAGHPNGTPGHLPQFHPPRSSLSSDGCPGQQNHNGDSQSQAQGGGGGQSQSVSRSSTPHGSCNEVSSTSTSSPARQAAQFEHQMSLQGDGSPAKLEQLS